jgi:predicted dehydrogenase
MKNPTLSRRQFVEKITTAGMAVGMSSTFPSSPATMPEEKKRIGIIGLDTSHSIAFTKALNDSQAGPEFGGYRVVAAYPHGSKDIESSVKRIPGYMEEIKQYHVAIVDSIPKLLDQVDVVLLETNDGRLHLEQALPVLKAGKRMFIDKPMAASLADVMAIFAAAKRYNVPMFSSSSLRYMKSAQEVVQGKVGKVVGAEAYSPAHLEKTHPDLVWYGIHGVETLFTVMGTGCKHVVRTHTENTDVVIGTWHDNRIDTFRGLRSGKLDYGGTVYGESGITPLGPYDGYNPLLVQIIQFFQTGKPPVSETETLEIFAFMEAADESKRLGGTVVTLESMFKKAQQPSKGSKRG